MPAPWSSWRTASSTVPSPASAPAPAPPRCATATASPRRCSTGSRSSRCSARTARGYSPSDVKIIEAISRFRAGGYDEEIGFTVYDTLRYKSALEDLVRQEVEVVMDRLAGEVSPERVVEMLEAGAQPLQDLIAALHTKLMVAELERHRAGRA